MRTILKNLFYTFRRFFAANVLNIVGLALAFAAFYVIIAQVGYDYGYNRSIKDSGKVYCVTIGFDIPEMRNYGQTLPRPLAENMAKSSPHIIGYGLIGYSMTTTYKVDDKEFSLKMESGIRDYVSVFEPEMLSGTSQSLAESTSNVLISDSMAKRLFGTTDAVGKDIMQPLFDEQNLRLTVSGVYRDYPDNNFLHDVMFFNTNDNENSLNNWNYNLYIRIDDNANIAQIKEDMFKAIANTYNDDEDVSNVHVYMVSLNDLHFYQGEAENVQHSTAYMLICFSVLIVLIATINFMNFFLAETPMRLRSINTQKVLGATASRLRGGLLAEAVLISIVAFLLSLLVVVATADMGVQQLVQARLSLGSNVGLIVLLLVISIVVGLLAGAYPSYYVTSFPPALVLKGSFGLSPRGKTLRTLLVGVQFVISFVLVVFVGIMYMQSRYIFTSDYGYDKDQLIVATATPEVYKSRDAVCSELEAISGVEKASFSYQVINSGTNVQGWGRSYGTEHIEFRVLMGDQNYPDVLGLEITDGRGFNATDRNGCIMNEAARTNYPFLEIGGYIEGSDSLRIIGFCRNFIFSSFHTNDFDRPAAVVLNKDGSVYSIQNSIVNVRVSAGADMRAVRSAVQQTLEQFTPNHDFNVRFIDQVLEINYQEETLFIRQVLLFSLLAIVISIIGVFGLTMFESEYRRKEIGIRKVLGSTTAQIVGMFCRRYTYILLVCFVIAAPVGYIIGRRWLESFAVKAAISPLIFAAALLLMALITFATVTLQSWKNANANPVDSIKTE